MILRSIFRSLFHILGQIKISGLDNVPKSGPYLIAHNHISLFEPPLVLSFWPVAPEAIGAADVWERRGQNLLVRMYGTIPVHRGEYDRSLFDTMLAILQAGLPLVIAPEGGRSHTPGLRQGLPGIAYVVQKSGAPILPVGVVGSTEDFFARGVRGDRPVLEMRIGELFSLPPIELSGANRKKVRQENVDIIMREIASLLPPEYQGIYAT